MGILSFILAASLALIPASIAKSKGRDFVKWYLYGFLIFIVALIHSLLLEDDSTNDEPNYLLENNRKLEENVGILTKNLELLKNDYIEMTIDSLPKLNEDDIIKINNKNDLLTIFEIKNKAEYLSEKYGKDTTEKFIDKLYAIVFSEKRKNSELHYIEEYLDENAIETAKTLGRIYGQRLYYDHLAEELGKYGLGKDEIEQLISIEKERI
ncbi:MAG: hypothetical protein LBK74_06595 [Treponema sp.]|nr:hypothetical protein [Treponema sp.]